MSGAIVPIASPGAFAEAAIRLLEDRDAWTRASDAAIARVESRYDQRDMIARYRDVYARTAVAALRKTSGTHRREAS